MWATPRSISTVFVKFISFVHDSQIFFEPYLCAHWFGPESVQDARHQANVETFMKAASEVTPITGGFEAYECSYKWVKEQLEKPHAGKKLVFSKEMCFSVADKFEFLPKGYRHMFLVRHPLKVFSSWKKIYPHFGPDDFQLDEMSPVMFPPGFGLQGDERVTGSCESGTRPRGHCHRCWWSS